jgi:hypothetical protein
MNEILPEWLERLTANTKVRHSGICGAADKVHKNPGQKMTVKEVFTVCANRNLLLFVADIDVQE